MESKALALAEPSKAEANDDNVHQIEVTLFYINSLNNWSS